MSLKIENSRRDDVSRPVCVDLNSFGLESKGCAPQVLFYKL
jgi:hypothetical protein